MKSPNAGRSWLYLLWLGLFLLLGSQVWLAALPDLWRRACWLGEWPLEQGCENHPTGPALDNRPELLARHLQTHVGDAQAWTWWLRSLWLREDEATATVLPSAAQLAPYNTPVLLAQADLALKAENWPAAAQALVTLVERGTAEARPALLALMTHPQAQAEVLAQLQPESRWLDPVLASLNAQTDPAAVLAFVEEGRRLDILKPSTVLAMVDRLKKAQHWADAYMLWVSLRGEVPAGLYNGDFESRALRRGFDWEWPQQPLGQMGMRVQQASASPEPGQLLQIDLTGRAALPVPMVSQALWLPGQRYRLRARFMADALRSKEGLVWALRCAQGGERWAQTEALLDTQRRWTDLEIRFVVPAACVNAVRLQLEPLAPWEAKAGMSGSVFFDHMALEALDGESR